MAEDPKPPSGSARRETAAAERPTGEAPAIPIGAPPAMPPGLPPALPPTLPSGGHDDPPFGTIQVRAGAAAPAAAPVLATVRGEGPSPGQLVTEFGKPPEVPPDERYEIGDEIARGGMGRVVEATDTLLGRTVALKEALTTDPDVLRRFARETRITARLEHPSIVPVHDAGTLWGGVPFYVMRKVSGRPLEALVARATTLEERLALVPHMVATAHAIAHAHERGIVHRDIKPSNILVGDNGETIVIDWGLAKVIGEADEPVPLLTVGSHGSRVLAPLKAEPGDIIKTRAGIVYGTPGFMAPEQLRGRPVNERVDVYALGATLYHLLARKPPHHAKTADEMMHAAAAGPPTPLAELVPGVPPELSTIVDKALAHDPAKRYQDAHAVAEDLQRFLTGQLVASHHYSRKEKLVRFIRTHRTPVLIASAALLAMLIFGTVAVSRIVAARDRADESARVAVAERQVAEEQRARAEERADALTLTQARNEVDTNPTRAIAMLKPLVGKRPDEVRSIAIAARASGIAWALPASRRTATVQLSRDGRRVLAAGDDGVVRLHELDTRKTRTLVEAGGPVSARFADSERRVVLWRGGKLVVVEIASGAREDRPVPSAVVDLEMIGTVAYWTDDAGALWQLDLATKQEPQQMPLDERATQLAPSPDGRWIALYGEYHLLLHDRTLASEPPKIVADGKTLDLDWAPDGGAMAALVERDAGTTNVLQIEMNPEPLIVHRLSVGNRRFVVFSNDRMYTVGPTGVAVVSRNEDSGVRKQLLGAPVGLRVTREHGIVAGSQGAIAVLSDRGDVILEAPAGHIDIVEASPASPYVVAVIEDRLLVWNLDDVQPRQLAAAAPVFAGFVGPHHVLASWADKPAQLVEVATGKAQDAGPPAVIQLAVAPGGTIAAAIDETHQVWLVGPGRAPASLAVTADLVGMPGERDLVFATEAGLVGRYDVASRKVTTLAKRDAKLMELTWTREAPGWVAARWDDKTVWRKHLGTGVEATILLPRAPTSTILVAADGSIFYADGVVVRAWRADGTLDEHATLGKPITRIGLVGATRAIAFTGDGSAHLVSLVVKNRTTDSIVVGPIRAAMAIETGLLVVQDRGGIDVIDPLTRHRWNLTPPPGGGLEQQQQRRAGAYDGLQITPDGTRVLAQTPRSLVVWTLPAPAGPGGLAGWIANLTNAVVDPQAPGGIAWR